MRVIRLTCLLAVVPAFAQTGYDLLLQGGHVVDARNNISAVRDIAIKDGRIAAVAAHVDPEAALKVVNVGGLYVSPGLIDIHVHVYAGTGERGSYAGTRVDVRSEEHTSELQSHSFISYAVF